MDRRGSLVEQRAVDPDRARLRLRTALRGAPHDEDLAHDRAAVVMQREHGAVDLVRPLGDLARAAAVRDLRRPAARLPGVHRDARRARGAEPAVRGERPEPVAERGRIAGRAAADALERAGEPEAFREDWLERLLGVPERLPVLRGGARLAAQLVAVAVLPPPAPLMRVLSAMRIESTREQDRIEVRGGPARAEEQVVLRLVPV